MSDPSAVAVAIGVSVARELGVWGRGELLPAFIVAVPAAVPLPAAGEPEEVREAAAGEPVPPGAKESVL